MSTKTVETPLDPRGFFADWDFVDGIGNYAEHKACVMSAIVALERARAGVDLNGAIDKADCVCPVLRSLAIRRNDAPGQSAAERKAWALAMIPRLMGTNDGLSQTRAFVAADYACRVIAPEVLELHGFKEQAEQARALDPIVDIATAKAAQRVLRADADAYAYTAAAAAAAAYAAADAAAYAAADAAYAAYTAAAAAAAAYAAADAADAYADAAVRKRHLDELLERCLAIKPETALSKGAL